jgi:hypothetical protein
MPHEVAILRYRGFELKTVSNAGAPCENDGKHNEDCIG